MGVLWYFIVILISIFLTSSNMELFLFSIFFAELSFQIFCLFVMSFFLLACRNTLYFADIRYA
jgi:NADH:ubiquinone oxidoreductase subunit K